MPILATRVRDFMRINPLEFYGSKMAEDPIEFIREAYLIMVVIGIPFKEKAKLVDYQLKGVAKI